MSRAALAASRAIQIIDFLAAQGTTRFTLSQLARALDINNASCHGILQELTRTGHLSRHPVHKTYGLGPVLIAIGDIAGENHPVIGHAKAAAAALSRRLGVEVLLSMRAGDEVLGLAHFNEEVVARAWLRPGVRLPLHPPLGVTFMAWETEEEIEKWLAKGRGGKIDATTAANLRKLLESVRQKGFQVAFKADTHELANLTGALDVGRYEYHLDRWLTTLQPENSVNFDPMQVSDAGRYEVDFISAPVFDSFGRAPYCMTLYHFQEKMIGKDIKNCVASLLATCQSVGRDANSFGNTSRAQTAPSR